MASIPARRILLNFPLDLALAADAKLFPDTQVDLLGDYNLVEISHDDFYNSCIISRDVLQAAFFYESENDQTHFRFTNNPVIKNAFVSSINNCLSYNTLQLYDHVNSCPTQYPAPRLQAKYPGANRVANIPTVCHLPDQYIQLFATLLFNNPQTLGPFSNLQDIIKQMQYGWKGNTSSAGAGLHQPGLAAPNSSSTLGDQAYNYIYNMVDINNECSFTRNIYQQILADAPERFDQTDTLNNKCLAVPFRDGDVMAMDVRMYGTLSVDESQGVLIKKIIDMFPSGSAHISNYFIYSEDPTKGNILEIKPFTYRIRLIVGDPQNISTDPILYANGVMNSLFNSSTPPIADAYSSITSSQSLRLEALTDTVYNTSTSPAQKEINMEAMNSLHSQVLKLAKELKQINPASPSLPQRDTIKIITTNLLDCLSNCLVLFTTMNAEEIVSPLTYNAQTSVINIVGISKCLNVCSAQLSNLLGIVYNPIMLTQDMYSFALKQIALIVAALIDIAKFVSNPINKTDNQATLAYAFSANLAVANANAKITDFVNTPYLPIHPITHLPSESQRIPLIKISDLLINGGVLETICYMFISLADSYNSTYDYTNNRSLTEIRRNYPEPNSVIGFVRACFNNIMSVDLISSPTTFMPKLFNSVISICDLIDILMKPNYFDLKGYCLNYIDDIDRGDILEALTYGASIVNNTIKYSYTYTKGQNSSTLVYGYNTILDAINNWPLATSDQMYAMYATPPTYPLGGYSVVIGELITTINNNLLQTVNPSSDIASTATLETYPISKKVDKIINVEQYEDQVAEIYKLLVSANLTNIEEFSFALLNTLAYANIKSLLLNGLLIIRSNYSKIQDNISDINAITGLSNSNSSDAISILTSAESYNREIDIALERAYYAISQTDSQTKLQSSLQTAMVYISMMAAYAQAIFDLYDASSALINMLQNPSQQLLIDEYVNKKTQSLASSAVVNGLKALYGRSNPVILETVAAAAGPGVITTIYNMIRDAGATALANASDILSDILASTVVSAQNKANAQATVTEMIAYNATLAGITLPTSMTPTLIPVKRIFYAIVLAVTIIRGDKLVIAIAANSGIAEKQTDYSEQKTYNQDVASATP